MKDNISPGQSTFQRYGGWGTRTADWLLLNPKGSFPKMAKDDRYDSRETGKIVMSTDVNRRNGPAPRISDFTDFNPEFDQHYNDAVQRGDDPAVVAALYGPLTGSADHHFQAQQYLAKSRLGLGNPDDPKDQAAHARVLRGAQSLSRRLGYRNTPPALVNKYAPVGKALDKAMDQHAPQRQYPGRTSIEQDQQTRNRQRSVRPPAPNRSTAARRASDPIRDTSGGIGRDLSNARTVYEEIDLAKPARPVKRYRRGSDGKFRDEIDLSNPRPAKRRWRGGGLSLALHRLLGDETDV